MNKIKTPLLALSLLSIIPICQAKDEWDTLDKSLATAAIASTVIDWRQTQQIAKSSLIYHENNKILGEHPSINKVNTYFISSLVIGSLIADNLPSSYRKGFLVGITTTEILYVRHNLHIGVGVKF